MSYATSGQHLRWPPYPRYTYNQWKAELENGFDANTTWAGSNDRSPLFIAVLTGDINLTMLLLNYGAQTEDYNEKGVTVLHEAILKGHEEIAKLLLRYGANPNLPIIRPISRFPPPFYPGSTALHLAVLEGLLDVARCLMRHGADSQAMTLVGWTPVDVAVLGRQTSMLEILLEGCKFVLFEYRCQRDEPSETDGVEITRHLLEHGIRGTGARHVWFYRCQLCRLLSDPSVAEQDSSQLARFLIREMSDCLMKRAQSPCQITWDRKLCEACKTFEALDSDNVFNDFEHSPDEAALALSAKKGCNFCQFLLEALQNHADPSPIQENWLWQQFGYDSKVRLSIERKPWHQGYKMRIMCGELASTVKLDYVSRQINEAVANTDPSDMGGTASDRSFAIADAWLRGCQDDHPSCYRPTELGQLPTRVIDVGSEASPPYLYLTARERIPYAALSYCWGGQGNTRLLSTNADEYRTRLPSESLPRTISEAIEITRRMGVRYLWVDALCIMQDSASDLEQELSRMGDIYFNAWLTIAAKDAAKSSQGCFRERGWHSSALVPLNLRLPERVAQSRLQDEGDTWLTRAPIVNTRTSCTNRLMAMPRRRASPQETPILETRGWTLQEELLSRRMLIFGKDEVSWVCLETACSERRQTDVEVRSDSTWQNNCRRIVSQGVEDNRTTFKVSRPQVWAYWLDTVESFSRRRLSDRRDKVVALEGVQRAIGVCLNDVGVAGVWRRRFFWSSLLWLVEGEEKEGDEAVGCFACPSWSWASREGPVSYQRLECSPDKAKYHGRVVEWKIKNRGREGIEGCLRIQCKLLREDDLKGLKYFLRPGESLQHDLSAVAGVRVQVFSDFADFSRLKNGWLMPVRSVTNHRANHMSRYRNETLSVETHLLYLEKLKADRMEFERVGLVVVRSPTLEWMDLANRDIVHLF